MANEITNPKIKELFDESGLNVANEVKSSAEETISNSKVKAIASVSASELMQMDLKPPEMIVENMLSVGVNIIAGKEKVGKSWLCLDLGLSVARGLPFLNRKTIQGDALYLALEDSLQRLKNRLELCDSGEKPDNFHLSIFAETMKDGALIGQLEEYRVRHPKLKLIIIDTLQKVKASRGLKDGYEDAYGTIGPLLDFARTNNICIVLIHHVKKGDGNSSGDVFESVHGSVGLTGASDTIIVLQRNRSANDSDASMHITGRDVESQELLLTFENSLCKWFSEGNAEEVKRQKQIKAYNESPIVKTIKYRLNEIMADDSENIKVYVTTMNDLRNATAGYTETAVIGANEKDFSNIVSGFDEMLLNDGIEHNHNFKSSFRGMKGNFHGFSYINNVRNVRNV